MCGRRGDRMCHSVTYLHYSTSLGNRSIKWKYESDHQRQRAADGASRILYVSSRRRKFLRSSSSGVRAILASTLLWISISNWYSWVKSNHAFDFVGVSQLSDSIFFFTSWQISMRLIVSGFDWLARSPASTAWSSSFGAKRKLAALCSDLFPSRQGFDSIP